MKLSSYSRFEMKKIISNLENTLIISINDTDQEVKQMRSFPLHGSSHIRTYQFYDDDSHFANYQALRLLLDLDFAQNNHLDIAIHCYMGVSRSGAFAVFANEYLGLDIDQINNYKNYNRHVHSTLIGAAKIGFDPADSILLSGD